MEYRVKNFRGLITRIESESVKPGYAADMNNWVTLGDHIELRRGQSLLGSNVSGSGRVSGLFVGSRFDGTDIAHYSYGRKIKYYDTITSDWIEVSTVDVLPTAADGEDIAIDKYHSLAGAYAYLSSKNSGIYKIPYANPGSIVDLSSNSHRGKIRIKQNRMFLWDRKDSDGGFDQTGLYGSYIDKDQLSDYAAVSAESLGVAGSTTYSGTLGFKSGFPKLTCMYVSITATVAAGTEIFRDTRDGTLVSNFGGTGTINYATGAYQVTFSDVTTGPVTADYYTEDSSVEGIADFSQDSPDRLAGQGFQLRQDDGGAEMQNLGSIGGDEYCFHTEKTWRLTLTSDDTNATNLIYRGRVGIPYFRAACETGDGIYYIDATDPNEPFIRLLQIGYNNAEVVPKSISNDLDLSGYLVDKAVIFEWGVYICVAVRSANSTNNDTFFRYHKIWKSWEKHDYRVSANAIYNGGLLGGDSASNNVFQLFSGLTDEDNEIPNQWTTGKDGLNIEGVKYTNIFELRGLIDVDQDLDVYFAYDNGSFVKVGTIVGDGPYVDQSQRQVIGSYTEGSTEIGGGGDGIEASPYKVEFRVNTPRFEKISVRFVATKVGYVSVSEYAFKDIRFKGKYLPYQYIS